MAKIAIIDGDIVAYQSCPPRDKKDEDGNRIKRLDDSGHNVAPEMSPEEVEEYFEAAWVNFERTVNDLPEKTFCDYGMMALSGVRTFRHDLFEDYKVHRSRAKYTPNPAVPLIRARAVDRDMGIQALGYEADDLMRMWANQAREVGDEYVICSYDKDLLCIPGTHFIMHKDRKLWDSLEVSKWEAKLHYYQQLLKGDMTDNIPGIPNVGPKRAEKMLEGCITEKDMQEVVAEQYFAHYGPDEWMNYLLINAKLIHILNHPDDYFNGEDWEILRS